MATAWKTGMKLTDARLTADGGTWTPGTPIRSAALNVVVGRDVAAGQRLTPVKLNA